MFHGKCNAVLFYRFRYKFRIRFQNITVYALVNGMFYLLKHRMIVAAVPEHIGVFHWNVHVFQNIGDAAGL